MQVGKFSRLNNVGINVKVALEVQSNEVPHKYIYKNWMYFSSFKYILDGLLGGIGICLGWLNILSTFVNVQVGC